MTVHLLCVIAIAQAPTETALRMPRVSPPKGTHDGTPTTDEAIAMPKGLRAKTSATYKSPHAEKAPIPQLHRATARVLLPERGAHVDQGAHGPSVRE
ncbi:hypothetical protein GCM10010411_36590 [Actinomadura fulvescens]|uniref:Secreted protein n=1 Tax=Actinomadura fulvescens TaxID=46160 RepID=A0ABN3PWD3_9ACTN